MTHQALSLGRSGSSTVSARGRSITYTLYVDHVAKLIDEAVYHAEHLRIAVPDQAEGTTGCSTVT